MLKIIALFLLLTATACTPREYYLFQASEHLYPANRSPFFQAARALGPQPEERKGVEKVQVEYPLEMGTFLVTNQPDTE